uniref:Uncharacterized protein n=1 Tax=Globodera pallida TaxID=36090 RepID=A0A183C0R2_GLOPA
MLLLLNACRLSCCAVILFSFFRTASTCFGGGLGCGGMGGPWAGGPGAFGWGGGLMGGTGADWSMGRGGYAAPFLGAYGAPPYMTGAYATGLYAAAPAAAAFIGPCCAPTAFGGGFIGFRRKRRRSSGDGGPPGRPTFVHAATNHYQKHEDDDDAGHGVVPSNKTISTQTSKNLFPK